MSQALLPAHQQIAGEVRPAPSKNVDETGWKQAGGKRWLWVAVTATATLFVIALRRGAVGLKALLGEAVRGLVTSGRWSAYGSIPVERRQLFDRWHQLRRGELSRRKFAAWVEAECRPRVRRWLELGAESGCARTAATCAEVLKLEPALWTFARVKGVEPTNNAAERALRPAVIKRKRSFGCHSEAGCRFVERLLSVTQTLRQRQRPVLDYLVEALTAHRHGLPAPELPTAC
jgi:transposase